MEEALVKLHSTGYTLSMLDLDLSSEESGLSLLQNVRAIGRGLPAIVLSANDDRETFMRFLVFPSEGVPATTRTASQRELPFRSCALRSRTA